MTALHPYVDEALAAELEAQGIEVVDCRVTGSWHEPPFVVDVRRPSVERELRLLKPGHASPSPPVNTTLLESLFPDSDQELLDTPAWREWRAGSAQGREYHEAALKLADEEGIGYDDAIRKVLK